MANFINKYASQALYDADSTKQYPNVSMVDDVVVYSSQAPVSCAAEGTSEDIFPFSDLTNGDRSVGLTCSFYNTYDNVKSTLTLQEVIEMADVLDIQGVYNAINIDGVASARTNCLTTTAITTEFDDTYEVDGAPVDAHLIHFPFGTVGYYEDSNTGDLVSIIDITADLTEEAKYDVVIYPSR